MFGYRLIRDTDYDRLRHELEGVRADLRAAQLDVTAATVALGEAKASERAATIRAELFQVDINVLRHERAALLHRVTGLPQIAPQIVSGPPSRYEALGAGVDLYDDVGDVEAERLKQSGLLHDDPEGGPSIGMQTSLSELVKD